MEKFIAGDVIVLPFPFTNLSSTKKRPALILANLVGDDYIMLQITSKNIHDAYAIPLLTTDFSSGSLHQDSNIRPNKIFTLDRKLILYKIGHLSNAKLSECVNEISSIISYDKQKHLEYEAQEKTIRDHNQMMFESKESGIEEGIKIGKTQKSIVIAKNLIVFGMSSDNISKITGLSIKEIEKIHEKANC